MTVVFGFPVETARAADPSGRLSVPLLPGWSAEEEDAGYTRLTSPNGGARAYLLSLKGGDTAAVLALLYPLENGGMAVGALRREGEINLVLLVQAGAEDQVLPALVQEAQVE